MRPPLDYWGGLVKLAGTPWMGRSVRNPKQVEEEEEETEEDEQGDQEEAVEEEETEEEEA